MQINLKPLTLISACLAASLTSLTIVEIHSADAAVLTWGLTFTSNSSQVGTGEFSYDTDKVAIVRTPAPYTDGYIADKNDPIRADFVPPVPGLWAVTQYANPIENFIARLPGKDWTLLGLSWFDPSTPSVLGGIGCSRTTCGVAGQWFGGSPTGQAPGQFVMYGAQLLEDGSYTGSFISAPISASGSAISGTWTAAAAPEPTTIAGALIFGAGCLASKRRRDKSAR